MESVKKDTGSIGCVILAGGKSSRLHSKFAEKVSDDKSLILLNGKPLISYVCELVNRRDNFSDIVVVVKSEEQKNKLEKRLPGMKIVADKSEICSPIAGIKEGIMHVKGEWVLVLACDMPFLDDAILSELIANFSCATDCVVYAEGKRYQPLCAIYRKQLFADCSLTESLHKLIDRARKTTLAIKNSEKFFNINTLEDLTKAEKMMRLHVERANKAV